MLSSITNRWQILIRNNQARRDMRAGELHRASNRATIVIGVWNAAATSCCRPCHACAAYCSASVATDIMVQCGRRRVAATRATARSSSTAPVAEAYYGSARQRAIRRVFLSAGQRRLTLRVRPHMCATSKREACSRQCLVESMMESLYWMGIE